MGLHAERRVDARRAGCVSWNQLELELAEMFDEYSCRSDDVANAMESWSAKRIEQQRQYKSDSWVKKRDQVRKKSPRYLEWRSLYESTAEYREMKRRINRKVRSKSDYKAKAAARSRAWRAANDNKVKAREYQAAWREKNRERLRAYKREWNAKRYAA